MIRSNPESVLTIQFFKTAKLLRYDLPLTSPTRDFSIYKIVIQIIKKTGSFLAGQKMEV